MNYSLKNLKINRTLSQETLAFSASVYLGSKRVGEVINHGCGGANAYFADAKCPTALRDFLAFAKSQCNGNEDVYVDNLIENVEFKKECKTKTIFRLPDGSTMEYATLYGPGIKAHIQTKWPDAEIINERFAA
jgi:hypothetical protein